MAGQGAGKSIIGAYDLLCQAKADRLYMVTASTYKVLRQSTIRVFHEVMRRCGRLVKPVGGEDVSAVIAPFGGGRAEVFFRSTEDPDNLRGPTCSGIWMDEASLSEQEAFRICTLRLREAGEMGFLLLTFTPKGQSHWTYEVLASGKRDDVFLVQARTEDNPFVSEEFLASARQSYTGLLADQELGGLFVSVEGAEWPADYFPDSIMFDNWPTDAPLQKVLSLDPSKGKVDKIAIPKKGREPDFSAYVMVGVDRDGILWIDADMDNHRDTARMVTDGIEIWKVFGPSAIVVEINQFQSMIASEMLRQSREKNLMLPVWGINNSDPKRERIRTLGPFLARGEMRFRNTPGGRRLVQQMRDFPQGQNDDGPDALEMAIRMIRHLRGQLQGNQGPKILRA